MKSIAFACGLAAALWAAAAQADQVVLRESAAVNGSYIRLGDLFTHTGDKTDIIVAYAPAPGRRAIFDARWLYRVARGYGLVWRPMGPRDQVVVRRNSQLIGRQEIEDHILAALMERGVGEDMQVVLSNRSLRLHVPGDSSATVAVEDVSLDRRSGRFSATIVAPADEPTAQRVRVTGRLYRMTEVPVLTRRKLAKEVIEKEDIAWILLRSDRIQRDIVLDAKDLIGKAPRRSLRDHAPIRAGDVRFPVMVGKGSLVTMVLRTPLMTLTAKGKALEDGSDGETIRIVNSHSNTVVEAVVIGINTVTVRPIGRAAMN